MVWPIWRAWGLGAAWLGIAAAMAGAPPDARAAEGRIDGERWARRNVELIRQELAALKPEDRGRVILTAVGFSLKFNPLLLRDPHAGEVAALAEASLPRAGAAADSLRKVIALCRRTEAERKGMDPDEVARVLQPDRPRADGEPVEPPEPPDPGSIAEAFLRLPPDRRAARGPATIAEMEAAARASGRWGRLGLGYLDLAWKALKAGDRARAVSLGDRLLATLREHPGFQDPARGNADAVSPTAFAAFFAEAGRRDGWDAYLAGQPDATRADVAVGEVNRLALKGDFDAARVVIDRQLRPIRPDSAARLEAATRGEILLPPSRPSGRGVPDPPPEEGRLRQAQDSLAYGQATRGEVELAARMLMALQRDEVFFPAGPGRLAAYEWARLAMRAAEAGHPDAARLGFDRANAMMEHDILLTPAKRDEKARLVREAVGLGRFDIANAMRQTSSDPGAWTRLSLARAYRSRGDDARAAALLDEGIAIAAPKDAKEGGSLAEIAVELQRMGQPDRAERALLDSLARIHGEDFGFSGTASVVDAAVAMDRVDLLDRLYDRGDGGEKLLLCIMASRRSIAADGRP